MQDLPNGGGGGGGRCKHWPPGAGDPRYATAYESDAMSSREILRDMHLIEPCKVKVLGFFLQNIF